MIHAKAVDVTKACAALHNINADQLAELMYTDDKSTIAASDDLKCFAKCEIEKTQLVKGTGLNEELLMEMGRSHHIDETMVSATMAKCQGKITASNTCSEAWDLYVCIKQKD